MYGNYLGGPFMMPNMTGQMLRGGPPAFNMMRSAPMINASSRGNGLLSSLFGLGRGSSSLAGSTSTFNFSNLLNGASKALGVVNQAIPIVKEVSPMMRNMKQILKIASAFKDETDISSTENTPVVETNTQKNDTITNSTTNNKILNNEPNFFL